MNDLLAPSPSELKAIIESLLFVAEEPLEISALARTLRVSPERVVEAVDSLTEDCQERGLRVQNLPAGQAGSGPAVQMVTAPEAAPYVERFLGLDEEHRLSHPALETLAIIAYRQPITRPAIEAIRGVNCDRAIASLKARGLITEVGRASTQGRPYLFGTTFRFLEYFGLEKPEDLPPLQEEDTSSGSAGEAEPEG
jgi:segregation and condensation protein B